MKKILLSAIIILILSCCSTVGVSDKNIATLQVALFRYPDEHLPGLPVPLTMVKPGERCRLQMIVYTREGVKIENPSIHDFTFKSSNNSFINFEKNFDDTICFTANPDSFYFADGKKFLLHIGIINNSFNRIELEWDVDWNATSVFDFSGRNGGLPDVNYIFAGIFSSGTGGSDGKDGENGTFCHFDIAYYNLNDKDTPARSKAVVVYDRIRGKLYFTKIETHLLFITDGGNGSDGLDASPSWRGHKAVRGGNGGNGGNGGDIILNLYDKTDLPDYICVKQNGGKSGAGGKGSLDSDSGKEQVPDGFPGNNGHPGKLIINRYSSFAALFNNVSHPHFKKNCLQ